ncbi:MAG: sigma-70 family RNA polymerase sigma factor [Lachnospiraceae bacterium]|nr:sigma-70 family RNA polymerase sigma factor [Lachnospiraceae bacterium]
MDMEEQYDRIYRYCYFKLKNAYLAEDVTQETFLRFLECDNYKDAGRPLAFLYTVARNLCVDEFRKKRMEQLPDEMPGDNEEDAMVCSLSVRMAMEQLTETEREMVLLRYVNEVPVSVIGAMYQMSRFALYREMKRILKKLERGISDETGKKG